jgi:hypothetical protein
MNQTEALVKKGRTHVSVPLPTFHLLKARASLEGKPMGQLIRDLLTR